MIKAIETQYKGYRFRSRLEARWAVFFNALGLNWEYEKEGFEMDGVRYLPDFHLPDSRLWIEIKPDAPSKKEIDKVLAFVKETEDGFLVLIGQPYLGEAHNILRCEYRGLLFRETKSGSIQQPLRISGLATCRHCGELCWTIQNERFLGAGPIKKGSPCRFCRAWFNLPYEAYAKARGARFEHGETPE